MKYPNAIEKINHFPLPKIPLLRESRVSGNNKVLELMGLRTNISID